MPVKLSQDLLDKQNSLTAYLSGDLDHHTVSAIREKIDMALRTNPINLLILDFSEVAFMDSSGIGLVLGRYKLITELGGKCVVANPPAYVGKVLKLSGINRLCEIVTVHSLPDEPPQPAVNAADGGEEHE